MSRSVLWSAVLFGVISWILMAALQTMFGPQDSFFAALLYDVAVHTFYERIAVLVLFVAYGFLVGKLRETEAEYQAVFENTGAATCIIDPDTTLSLVVEQFASQTGYSREELEGKKAGGISSPTNTCHG